MWPLIILVVFVPWSFLTLYVGYKRGRASAVADAYAQGRKDATDNKRSLIRSAYAMGYMKGKSVDKRAVSQQHDSGVS